MTKLWGPEEISRTLTGQQTFGPVPFQEISWSPYWKFGTSTRTVTVKGNNSTNFDRYDVTKLALTKGCLGNVCVGQKVVPDNYAQGFATISGINFYNNTFTVKGNNSTNYDRYTSSNIGLKKGCLQGICVGDQVLPDNYAQGYAIVEAINFTTKKFTVKGNNSTNFDRYSAESISIINECTDYDSSQRYEN